MKSIKECTYSAFISYAHDDDVLVGRGWFQDFRIELQRGLEARVREAGVKVPQVHLSQENGPVAGYLSQQLRDRVAASFAMVVVVGDAYAHSKWCLAELEMFKELHGEQGLRERLFIVALSRAAIDVVSTSEAWRRLLPGDEQLWIGFFPDQDGNDHQPPPVLLDSGTTSSTFLKRFSPLRDELAKRIRDSVAGARPVLRPWDMPARPDPVVDTDGAPPPPGADAEPDAPSALVFAFVPGLEDAARQAAERLRAQQMDVRQLGVADDPLAIDGARMLVVPFDDKPVHYLVPAQVGRWMSQGRRADSVRWLDLRGTPGAQPLPAGVAPEGQRALGLEALCDELRPRQEAPEREERGVTIYIESNQNEQERNLWLPLGDQLSRKWDEYFPEHSPERRVPLYLKARGLPVDEIERLPPLDDADGVVLLWGKKTPEALVAQIDKVEGKLKGKRGPPSIVAFLMPPQASDKPLPAWGWRVLRFDTKDDANIGVLDEGDLRFFLKQVHDRGRRRAATAEA